MLIRIADAYTCNKKTYNNAISALRRAFNFGYLDYHERADPPASLKCARIGKNDRPPIDPFSIQDAEVLIAAIHRDWGEAQGNYDELRFFTGLRPSEEIALAVTDYDAAHRVLSITKARVVGIPNVLSSGSGFGPENWCPTQVVARNASQRLAPDCNALCARHDSARFDRNRAHVAGQVSATAGESSPQMHQNQQRRTIR